MSANLWVEQFRALHSRARKGGLTEEERGHYLQAREQFARAMTAAQGLTLLPGQSARRAFRIAQSLQVDLTLTSGPLRAMTADVSMGGFSVLMHKPPADNEEVGFTLRLPGTLEPITARARTVNVQRKVNIHRVAFALVGLGDKELERLETAMFDLALERIK